MEIYPLVMTGIAAIAIEHGPVEIVIFSIQNGNPLVYSWTLVNRGFPDSFPVRIGDFQGLCEFIRGYFPWFCWFTKGYIISGQIRIIH